MGKWFGDVSARYRRQLPTDDSVAPLGPSAMVWRTFLQMEVGQPQPPPTQVAPLPDRATRDGLLGGRRVRYHPAHMLETLRVGQHVSNRAKVRQQIMVGLRWLVFWSKELVSQCDEIAYILRIDVC